MRWWKGPHWGKGTEEQGDSSAPETATRQAGVTLCREGSLTDLFATWIQFWSMWRILLHTAQNWFFKELYWKKSHNTKLEEKLLCHLFCEFHKFHDLFPTRQRKLELERPPLLQLHQLDFQPALCMLCARAWTRSSQVDIKIYKFHSSACLVLWVLDQRR